MDQLLTDIRSAASYLRTEHQYSLPTLAQLAGLHKNSIMKIDDPDWKPNGDTITKLEVLIDRAAAKKAGETFANEQRRRGRPLRRDRDTTTAPLTKRGNKSRTSLPAVAN